MPIFQRSRKVSLLHGTLHVVHVAYEVGQVSVLMLPLGNSIRFRLEEEQRRDTRVTSFK